MSHRALISSVAALCTVLCATTAHAQIGSSCLRPLGIPDRWIERQTPPWDPTDTFDPTGPEPDLYDGLGYNLLEDHGRPISLVLYDRVSPLKGESAWPITVGQSGLHEEIVACSGYLHFVGASFPAVQGASIAPFGPAFGELIAQDPDARWDPTANGGRGGVVDSAYGFSPRVIALPVFAPDSYATAPPAMSPAMIRIVGFFVSERIRTIDGYTIHGYLTGWSHVEAADVTGRMGDYLPLSAKVTSPGSPIVGLPIEFLHQDRVVATAETDGTGTARTMTMAFQVTDLPGEYPGAIRARIKENASFFVADEASAMMTVLKRLPLITWLPPADITYGTPLGAAQLNASADAAGTFTYSPAAGTVLGVTDTPVILTVTFVPAEDESQVFDTATATTFISVAPAPLTLAVNPATKLYLDPLPPFSTAATGFVNGDGPSAIDVSTGFMTAATATSAVGTYTVVPEWYGAANYTITLVPGVLTIVPRPTMTALQVSGPSPSVYGQTLSFTIAVSSGVGEPDGTVTLASGGVPVATAPLIGGHANVTVSSLDAGTHTFSAAYGGSSGFAGSTSSSIVHTVAPASTATALSSSVNPSRTGQPVTFTATVTTIEAGAAAASGSVEFLRNGVVIGTASLTGATAELTVDSLPVGKFTMQARYAGSNNHRPSASAVLQQTVKGGGK
jgi:hypothetical protein